MTAPAPISQQKLADALGVSKTAVQKLIKRGMPRTSPEAAAEWRARNCRPRGQSAAAKLKPGSVLAAAREAGTAADIKRLLETSKDCHAAALERGDDYAVRAWALALGKLISQLVEAEAQDLLTRQTAGELMTAREAHETLGVVVGDIRRLLDTMPDAVAVRANPHDPAMAREALVVWRDAAFRTLHGGNSGSGQLSRTEASGDFSTPTTRTGKVA